MKHNLKELIKPAARRPIIPQGTPMQSRLDRRKKERSTSWKREHYDRD